MFEHTFASLCRLYLLTSLGAVAGKGCAFVHHLDLILASGQLRSIGDIEYALLS
jgi:hypothetical protein